ncbi:unannotated protein [freshwater metagenome]|uniref:Unannotated protein n=1 Tax=freshwater metagenome TaxID=449393 RepID=A0A6J7EYM5_9ZZZZ|nr:hypothetical protein [Actinomycetota bacterium]
MYKFVAILFATALISSQTVAIADPPPGSLDIQERLVIEACILTSEKPHISKHLPGTVNVTGRTICKGISAGRTLSIRITLTREDGGNTPPVTKSIRGVGSVIGNVSIRCIWQPKDALLVYTIETVHKMSNGKTRTTMNEASLKC